MPASRSFDQVVVGLGNPGADYIHTRHNLGERVVKAFGELLGAKFQDNRRFKAEIAKGIYNDKRIALFFPTTYMNLSGEALKLFIDYYTMAPSEVLVVCDDVDLPVGFLRLRKEGSAGGHNGLKSIEKSLGTQQYPRLKIGVGPKREQQDLASHVLSRFTNEEALMLPNVIANAVCILKRLVHEEIDKVMNDINKKVKHLPREGEENCHESKKAEPL